MPCGNATCTAVKAGAGFAHAAKYSRDRKILQTLDRDDGTPSADCQTSSPSAKSLRRRAPEPSEATGTFIAKAFAEVFAKALLKVVHESFICDLNNGGATSVERTAMRELIKKKTKSKTSKKAASKKRKRA